MWDDSNRVKWGAYGPIHETVKAVVEKPVEQTKNVFSFDLFAPQTFFAPVIVSNKSRELRNLIHICEEKGLTGQIGRLKRQALACELKDQNMTLITLRHLFEKGANIWEASLYYTAPETGEIHPLFIKDLQGRQTNDFSIHKVMEYDGYMPPPVIERIPEQFVDRSFVFKAVYVTDPIIAIPINEDTMIGLFQWDDPIIEAPRG